MKALALLALLVACNAAETEATRSPTGLLASDGKTPIARWTPERQSTIRLDSDPAPQDILHELEAKRVEAHEVIAQTKHAEETMGAALPAPPDRHADECRATYPTRLKEAQGLLPQALAIAPRCARLHTHCAITGERSSCFNVTPEDARFYQSICMSMADPFIAGQIPLIDESEGCADVDRVPLIVDLARTTTEVEAIRRAVP